VLFGVKTAAGDRELVNSSINIRRKEGKIAVRQGEGIRCSHCPITLTTCYEVQEWTGPKALDLSGPIWALVERFSTQEQIIHLDEIHLVEARLANCTMHQKYTRTAWRGTDGQTLLLCDMVVVCGLRHQRHSIFSLFGQRHSQYLLCPPSTLQEVSSLLIASQVGKEDEEKIHADRSTFAWSSSHWH